MMDIIRLYVDKFFSCSQCMSNCNDVTLINIFINIYILYG